MSSSSSSSNFPDKDEIAIKNQHIASPLGMSHTYENEDGPHTSNSGTTSSAQPQQQNSMDSHRIPITNSTVDPEKQATKTSTETNDPNIVWWSGPDDPQNPMNFTPKMKLLNIGLVSAICFVTPLASSMFAPGVPDLMREFGSSSNELASFVVSVYVLGFAVGPLALAPLSEVYGRLVIYHVCNVGFIGFTVGCALATDLNMLIAFRFMAGMFGSAPLTNGGGTIADMVEQAKRGKAMSGFAMGPIIGPIIGPVAGGYVSQSLGWRWVFWILTMISGICTVLGFIFMRETYAPVILERRAKLLRKETDNPNLRSKLDHGLHPRDFFLRSIVRPARMLIFSPIVLSTSLYVGVIYGYLYLMFTTFPLVFQGTYGFSAGSVGLTYLGLGVGSLIGVAIFAIFSDRAMKAATVKAELDPSFTPGQNTFVQPEFRLPMMIYTAPLIPIGLIIYAWTTHYAVHYIVPIMATSMVGLGNLMAFMCISTYLIDAFSVYAASALAASTVLRSVMGAVLPLCGQKMYKSLGLGWGSTTLALVAFALLPVPIVINRFGERLRKRFEIKDL